MNNKDIIQKEALKALEDSGGSGIIAAATGSGKTKIAIDHIETLKNMG